MFSTFPLAVDVRAGSQHDVLAVQASQLGDPEARLNGEQKQCPVAAPDPGGMVDRRQEGVDLFPIEKFDGPPLVAFGGHRQDSLAQQRMRRLLESHVLKEGVNCSETDITSASTILSVFLEMIKEITNE